jgi:microcystin-dependent protein
MSYSPLWRAPNQYLDENGTPYFGAVLKAYQAGTSTPISFALDSEGEVLVATIELNASGYTEVSGNVIIPYLNESYKLALYPDQDAADSDSGAIWTVDNVGLIAYDFVNNELTNLGDGTERSSGINVGQVQDSDFISLGTTGGSADAYTLNPIPEIPSYNANQFFIVKIHASNATTTPYLQISGISNPASNAVIKKLNASKSEIAVEANDLLANGIYLFKRNSLNNAWIVLDPETKLVPVGTVIAFAGNAAPIGYFEAVGADLSRVAYADLFAVFGTTFGSGDGSTTFGTPDLRGYFIRGWDHGRGIDSGRAFGSIQQDALQNITAGGLGGGHSNSSPLNNVTGAFTRTTNNQNANHVGGVIDYGMIGFDASLVARTSTETRPLNIALMYCIKY